MKPLFLSFLLLGAAVGSGFAQAVAPTLEVYRWKGSQSEKLGEANLEADGPITLSGDLQAKLAATTSGSLGEWTVSVTNPGTEIERLQLRLRVPAGRPGGVYWDGFEQHANVAAKVQPTTLRYRFPATAYFSGGEASLIGFAPQNLSSRFERACEVRGGKVFLAWDAYLVLSPGQTDQQVFVTGSLPDCHDYTEAVEAYYRAYPQWFRPVVGADSRLYGQGGYFLSSDAVRDLQVEEARRLHLDWEWLYAPFQRAGAIMPDETTWNPAMGFNVEETPSQYTEKGGLEGWKKYYGARIRDGDRTSGMFYYYLQQYADVDLVKTLYTDSLWVDAKGQVRQPTFGWIKTGLWIRNAWPGETLYGKRLRQDLAEVWKAFDVAGYALDCTMGDMPYYGEALPKEPGKAFDADGKVYVDEGIAVARNIDFTHDLPAHADGRKPASIVNEPVTYLAAFHGDAMLHEKPPYERPDLLPLRRLWEGQKPMFWWKGYRAENLLNWEKLSPADFREGLQGMCDYVTLSSLRFGGIPAIFFVKGYLEMHQWMSRLIEVNRAGWRAATYVKLPQEFQPANGDPYSLNARIWVSRYGNQAQSWVVLSSPKREPTEVPIEIETARFQAGGSIYLDTVTNQSTEHVSGTSTVVDLVLEDHQPAVLQKVAELTSPGMVHVTLERKIPAEQGGSMVIRCAEGWPAQTKMRWSGEEAWRECSTGEMEITQTIAPSYQLVPSTNWIDQLELGNEKKAVAVILSLPEDRVTLDTRLIQLSHYWEYYNIRKKSPVAKLSDVKSLRMPALVFPVVNSPGDPALQRARTVFVVGKAALALVQDKMPGSKETHDAIFSTQVNGQHWIAVDPGQKDEAALWGDFLNLLDVRYPFVGALEMTPWFSQEGLAGKVFDGPKPEKSEGDYEF